MLRFSLTALLCSCLTTLASAQRSVPFEFGIPKAPEGLANQALDEGPFVFATAEGMRIRVSVLTRDLEYPYAMLFLPDGDMLITTRGGELRRMRGDELDADAIEGGPESFSSGLSGLPGAVHGYMNIALHPDFERNDYIYLSYTKPLDDEQRTLAIGRGRWNGESLRRFNDIYVGEPGDAGPAPLAFGTDGMLYFAASGGDAQDTLSIGGKVMRIADDGDIPEDNPFIAQDDYKPEIYTLGHRNSLGLGVHPVSGAIWQHEMGPNGGDEINVLRPGANYGWPIVSLGRTYQGPWQNLQGPTHQNFAAPIVYWMPSISLSGMEFYTGAGLPLWTGDIFVGGLRYGEIPGTGQLTRILFNEDMQELRREVLLAELHQRIRDVRQGPDGLLYVLTDEAAGAVLRIEPAD